MTTTTEGTGTRIRRRAAVVALAAAGAIALVGPASADALALSDLQAEPANTQAGANADFELNVAFDTEDVENLRIGLPPGVVGDPGSTVQCTSAQLHASTPSCPAESQVGSTTVNATVTVVVLPVTLNITGKLYNLEPQPGEPARFGIVLLPVDPLPLLPVVLESGVELRQSDLGLDTVIEDIPNTTSGIPTHINSMHVSLFGNPPGGTKPFMRNPTSCGTATTNFTADPYGSETEATGSASFTPTGCDQVPFSPTFTASVGSPGHTAINSKPPVTTSIQQDFDEAGLKRAHVLLPTSIGSDTNVLSSQCAPADFQAGTCAPSTVIGSALASSPLLTEPLTGPVIVVGNPGGLPRIGLDLTGPLSMKLMGDFVTAPSAGLEFAGLPDIPIADFSLTFDQDRLVINLTSLCDGAPRTFNTTFDGHNGATQAGSVAATLKGLEGCGAAAGKTKKCKKKGKKRKGKGKAAAAKKKKKKCKRKKRRKK